MDVSAQVGPVTFLFAATATGILPEMAVRPFMLACGESVGVAQEGGLCLLVVDHRSDPAAPSRVEFWRPVETPEAALGGLIVAADSLAAGTCVRRFRSLEQLVRVLAGGAAPGEPSGHARGQYRHDH
jgi:hypothetical protein